MSDFYKPIQAPDIKLDDGTNALKAYHDGFYMQRQQNLDNVAQQKRDLNAQVGGALANDDMDGAKSIAAKGGDLDTFKTIKDWQDASDDKDLQQHKQNIAKIAGLAQSIQMEPDPVARENKWQAAKATAAKVGVPLGNYANMPGDQAIPMILSEAGQGQALVDQQMQQKAELKDRQTKLAQALALAGDDEGEQANVLKLHKQLGTDVSPFIDADGKPLPGAVKTIIGMTPMAKSILDNQTKETIAETKARSGGSVPAAVKWSNAKIDDFKNDPRYADYTIPSEALQKVRSDPKTWMLAPAEDGSKTAIAQMVDARTKTAVDLAEQASKQNAALNEKDGGTRETDPIQLFRYANKGDIAKQQADTRKAHQQFSDNPEASGSTAYKNTEEGARQITGGRESAKADIKLDAQKNRLENAHAQVQQIRDYMGEPGSQQRKDFESALGPVAQNLGKEYWGKNPNVRSLVSELKSRVATLQDEVAQYVQVSGASSDVRAKKAYEAVGNLNNSTDVPTLVKRLDDLESKMQSLKQIHHLPKYSVSESAPAAKALAPSSIPKDWSKASDDELKQHLGF